MRKIAIVLVFLGFSLQGFSGCHRPPPSTVPSPALAVTAATVRPGTLASAPNAKSQLARRWTRPFLYRVATKSSPFFLLGTIHVPDARFETLPKELEAAYRLADALYTEIPIEENVQLSMMPFLLLPAGQGLDSLLPKALYERLENVFETRGLPMEPLNRIKPWAISLQVVLLDQSESAAQYEPLDAMLYKRAKADKKAIGGLETVREQLELFDGLTSVEQIEMLEQTLDHRDRATAAGRNIVTEMLDAYVAGEEVALERIMREEYDPTDALSVKLMKRVLFDRNESLTARMLARVRAEPQKVFFFAVGSGHVVGKEGIVERLRQQGLLADRVVQ